MQLLLYSNLNKLIFNLLHNSRLSIIEDHQRKEKEKCKCNEV
jgi:hypothetical protein